MDLNEFTKKLIVYKLRMFNGTPQVYLSVRIAEDLTWEVYLCGKLLKKQTQILSEIQSTLSTPTEVGNLLRTLEQAQLCIGNEDDQFLAMASSSGEFFNKATSEYMT